MGQGTLKGDTHGSLENLIARVKTACSSSWSDSFLNTLDLDIFEAEQIFPKFRVQEVRMHVTQNVQIGLIDSFHFLKYFLHCRLEELLTFVRFPFYAHHQFMEEFNAVKHVEATCHWATKEKTFINLVFWATEEIQPVQHCNMKVIRYFLVRVFHFPVGIELPAYAVSHAEEVADFVVRAPEILR